MQQVPLKGKITKIQNKFTGGPDVAQEAHKKCPELSKGN